MTNEQKLVAAEYNALGSAFLGLGEIEQAIIKLDTEIIKRINIISHLARDGGDNDDGGFEALHDFILFYNNVSRLRERLRMMRNLCHDDAKELVFTMDSSASRIIGIDNGEQENDERQ